MAQPLRFLRLRWLLPATSRSSRAAYATAAPKKNLVFMGTPQVAASVLDNLLDAANSPSAPFQVAAVVTHPPAARDRRRRITASPVHQLATERGFPSELIFTPERCREVNFLSDIKAVSPDVCVTAAYGKILPQSFLDIPLCGTVNIHPSLLPLYRGAAPVQRALQDGVTETGVSLVYTIRQLDAGPVIAKSKMSVDECIKAPELLEILFKIGSELLLREIPSIFDGSARLKAHPQDDSKATLAPKVTVEESRLSFEQEALILHNKVRAFAGWPGTWVSVQVVDEDGSTEILEFKVVSTKVHGPGDQIHNLDEIFFNGSSLVISCAGDTWLEILELQLPGKKVIRSRDFWNGLRGKKLMKLGSESSFRSLQVQ